MGYDKRSRDVIDSIFKEGTYQGQLPREHRVFHRSQRPDYGPNAKCTEDELCLVFGAGDAELKESYQGATVQELIDG